jgi:hypothetical protein
LTQPSPDDVGRTILGPRWVAFRGVVTFLLGVAVVVDSLVEKNTATVGKLIVGLLLIGVPTIEDMVRLLHRRNGKT